MNRRQDGHLLGFEWDLWLDNRDLLDCWRTDLWNNHKPGIYLIVAVALWPELRFVVGDAGILHVCFIEAPIYMYPRLLNAVAHVTNTSRTTRETNLYYAESGTENLSIWVAVPFIYVDNISGEGESCVWSPQCSWKIRDQAFQKFVCLIISERYSNHNSNGIQKNIIRQGFMPDLFILKSEFLYLLAYSNTMR